MSDRSEPMRAIAAPGERLEGLDVLKGVAIVLVVLIHTAPTGETEYIRTFVNGPARLAVPLFFAVTGYLIGLRRPPRERLAGSFRRFLLLHFLYGALYWAIEPLNLGSYAPLTFKSAVMHFGVYAYPGQFFLFGLVLLYFGVAFVVPERRRGDALWPALALGLAAATVGWLTRNAGASGGELQRIAFANLQVSVGLWLYPFALGLWLGERVGVLRPRPGAAAAAFAAACALAALDLPRTGGPEFLMLAPYARWSLLIGVTLLALALPVVASGLRSAPLAAVGRESFGIFVFNPLIILLLVLSVGAPQAISGSLALAAVTLGLCFALSRWLRPRLPIAFP